MERIQYHTHAIVCNLSDHPIINMNWLSQTQNQGQGHSFYPNRYACKQAVRLRLHALRQDSKIKYVQIKWP
jgi:hypothetical protein